MVCFKNNYVEVHSCFLNLISDIDYQRKLEDVAFEVVQLTFLQDETFTDAKNLRRTVEKSTKDRENLELQKLRQESFFNSHLVKSILNSKFLNSKFQKGLLHLLYCFMQFCSKYLSYSLEI